MDHYHATCLVPTRHYIDYRADSVAICYIQPMLELPRPWRQGHNLSYAMRLARFPAIAIYRPRHPSAEPAPAVNMTIPAVL